MTDTPPDDVPDVSQIPCPACHMPALRIEWRLKAAEIGDFSLAGMQMKFSAREVPYLVCGNCGVETEGKTE